MRHLPARFTCLHRPPADVPFRPLLPRAAGFSFRVPATVY